MLNVQVLNPVVVQLESKAKNVNLNEGLQLKLNIERHEQETKSETFHGD